MKSLPKIVLDLIFHFFLRLYFFVLFFSIKNKVERESLNKIIRMMIAGMIKRSVFVDLLSDSTTDVKAEAAFQRCS